MLQVQGSNNWTDLYAIESQPAQSLDLEVANWFTSTHPESIFVKTRTAPQFTSEARFGLRMRTLTIVRAEDGGGAEMKVEVRELGDERWIGCFCT